MRFPKFIELKKMVFQKIIQKVENNPKQLFLVDGFGALLSAFLLGFVLVRIKDDIGMPPAILYVLAAIPIVFAIFDLYCYRKEHKRAGIFLKMIAILNIHYCIVSVGFAMYHKETLTSLGWIYIVVEVFIILLLSAIEFTVGKRLTEINND
ncbi:hypothetical protein [Kordia sp.]|uniref:hypothetical protein n=1 Tax=Kordia sp. TaxID=1965332 RepID=UPI0025BDB0C9|nr:hypothetical protein [Kordia sp.]MCH2192913.1 hypothetical protein [Kordia sp.]